MKNIVLFLFVSISAVSVAQTVVRYDDINLYNNWPGDSAYRAAYREYIADSARRTEQVSDPARELELLDAAFTEAFWTAKDYDNAFYIGFQLEEKLPQVSESEYPQKRRTYYKLGEAYYLMLDYHKSIRLLEHALSESPISFDDRANLDALNIIGICYANIGRMDASDDSFRATLLSGDIVLDRPLYNAYALAHLGCNAMLTGQYDRALAISDVAWPVLRRETEDYGHLAGMCYCRGRSYLEKGEFKQASVWIDSLVHFAGRDRYNRTKRLKQAHSLRADYYTYTGDARKAKIYNDSLMNVYRLAEQDHTSGYIARASHWFHGEKIVEHQMLLKTSWIGLSCISFIAICCLGVIFVILSLYRKKKAAYQALARKASEWARNTEPTAGAAGRTEHPLPEDKRIMSLMDKEMTSGYAYREPGLTIDQFATRLGVHRNALSRAVNRVTDGNFNQYINGYRIKEAIRLIAGTNHHDLRMEELYERVGFVNYATFYRTFKQMTGLSPVEFQKREADLIRE